MKKKALISIISKQDDKKDDVIEVVTPGSFYKKDNHYYAVYEETEISGMEGTTTTIKISNDNFILLRKGSTNTKMTFKKNLNDVVLYNTPHGTLELLIDIDDISIDVNDNGGKILAKYNMSVAGQEPLPTELVVEIKAEEKELN
ncbi:putative beta-barrel protein YwiB [Clostridium tepidiprofundi DSM 19306]|uniref:Putative beta-barrel protein YwiB n=1 Tax=Clostridium tepidiprofundi DSM 19306 TaxID=1121338 RepID=A0A151B4T8_9CLOT|nr:DUF1934 domain-containing protein [Clostridium tepidiprofundi]KYH34934.1 putative beta-barrel protein YwiB [Clostridium tepidiprofundi DSM 19306]